MKKKNFRSLELATKKHIQTYSSGIHATHFRDSLIEVDVVREYQPGDKRLDSKSSLKIGKMMARVFNPERSLNIFIILDLSSSIYSNIDQALIAALYLCYIGDICNEKTGLCVFSDKVLGVSEPTEDYTSITGMLDKVYSSYVQSNGTAIELALKTVSDYNPVNSLVVLISDFYFPLTDKICNSIKRISSVNTNTFLALSLFDKRDWVDFNVPFTLSLRDAESEKLIDFDLRNGLDYNSWVDKLKKDLWRAGCDVVVLNSDEDRFLMPLVKYLMRT